MERLPYIDEHAITVDADRHRTWSALLRVVSGDPRDPSTVPTGFAVAEAREPERLALQGRHPFAVYRWVFELDAQAPQRTRVRAVTWAAFPGLPGRLYRAVVIGTGGHRMVVRWTLKRIAAATVAGPDYADAFEAPILDGDSRTAEQAFRDALDGQPRAVGRLVLWVHRRVLRLHLGPPSSPEHLIGWKIIRSDPDELVLAADGSLMHGRLRLRRRQGERFVLLTQLDYHRKIPAAMVWLLVGPLHRTLAPRLIEHSARRGLPAPADR
jgi:hypothetical protein